MNTTCTQRAHASTQGEGEGELMVKVIVKVNPSGHQVQIVTKLRASKLGDVR